MKILPFWGTLCCKFANGYSKGFLKMSLPSEMLKGKHRLPQQPLLMSLQ